MAIKTDVQLKSDLDANIKTNGANSITGTVLNYYETDLLESKVSIIDNETINGVKTFGSFPVSPESSPSTDYQMANKKYVDDTIPTSSNYVDLTTAQSVGGVKTFTDFPVSPYSAPTTDYQVANKKYVDDNIGSSLWEVDGTETQLITADEIDMQNKKIINLADPLSGKDAVTRDYVRSWIRKSDISVDKASVDALGTEKTLIGAAGAGTYIRVIDVDMKVTVTTQLDAGSQQITLMYSGATPSTDGLYYFPNAAVETAATARYTAIYPKDSVEILENTDIVIILDGATNPASGSATMDFQITYEVLTY